MNTGSAMHSPAKPIHLPWHQAEQYWLCILPRLGSLPAALLPRLQDAGMKEVREGTTVAYRMQVSRQWGERWMEIHQLLAEYGAEGEVDAAVLPDEVAPDMAHMVIAGRPCAAMREVAESLWLGDALLNNELVCHFQPVINGRANSEEDKVFGYESLMRAQLEGGKVVGGGAVVKAARALSLQYAVDRHMQVKSVKTFMQHNMPGQLFINFIPGFIQRPEVYLEGLTAAVQAYNMPPQRVVLDLTNSESAHDVMHIARVAEYCRSKGYAIALDDVESVRTAQELIEAIRPEFVKLDASLVHHAGGAFGRDAIRHIVEASHAAGAKALAECVESQAIYNEIRQLGVDLFQGYFFSPPKAAEELVGKN